MNWSSSKMWRARTIVVPVMIVWMVASLADAHAQAWRPGIVGQAGATLGYTDNVFSVSDDAIDPPHIGDWFYRLRAGLAAHFAGRRQYSMVEYGVEGERYLRESDDILWVHRLSGVIHRTMSRRSTLDVAAGYERGRSHSFAGANGRRDQTLGTRVGEHAFSLVRGAERLDYEISDLMRAFERTWAQRFISEDSDGNEIDGFELGGQLGLDRQWRNTVGFVTAGPRFVSFSQIGAPERRRDLLLDVGVRVVRDLVKLGPAWAGSVDLGATVAHPITTINPDERTTVQPTAALQLTYAPADSGMLMLMARRSVVPSFEAGASTVTDRIAVVGNLPLMWNELQQRALFVIDVAAGWEQSRQASEVTSTRFRVRFADVGATYVPRVGLGIGLHYSYIDQQVRQEEGMVDALAALGDYDRSTVMLTVSGMWPGRGPRDTHVTGLGYFPSGDQTLPTSVLTSSSAGGGRGASGVGDGSAP